MSTLEERITQEKKNLEKLIRQKRAQDSRAKEKQKAIDTRRQIIIGGIVSEYFPEVLRFKPCKTAADNNIEFAPFANFLSMLAEDKQYVSQLKKRAAQKILPKNQQDPFY